MGSEHQRRACPSGRLTSSSVLRADTHNATDAGPAVLRVGGADVLHPRASDVETVMSALRTAGAPCQVSSDPGRYVCNATYYETLATFGGQIPVLFVHVPATTPLGGFVRQDTLATWMAASIDAFVEAAVRSPRASWTTAGRSE